MSSPARQAVRGVGAARVLVGLVTLGAAGRSGVPILESLPAPAVVAARVLAARDVVQGAALVLAPDERAAVAVRAGSAVDALHAASMLAPIVLSPRYRDGATLSAASALAWIAVTALARRA